MSKVKKIGIYGGTFDPIHFGHIHLAMEMKEKAFLDEILFCPANLSPYKVENKPHAEGKQRMDMIRLAIEDIENFSLSSIEIDRKGVSYTIDTLLKLKEEDPHSRFYLLLSEEVFQNFSSWKDSKKNSEIVPLLVGSSSYINEKTRYNETRIPIRRVEISSTLIRERLKKGLYCGHLTYAKVLDYIYKHQLYY